MDEGKTRNIDFEKAFQESDDKIRSGNNHLLIIGIDEYVHVGNLSNAVSDVQALRDLLYNKYRFEKTLYTELYDSAATYQNIKEAFKILTDTVHPGESLVIYFSGHGHASYLHM